MTDGPVLEAVRASLEIEVTRAERLEARARMNATLAAGWFALVQAVVTVGLKSGMAPAWEIAVGAAALAATAALALAAWQLARVWRLRPDPALTHEALAETAAALRSGAPAAGHRAGEEYEQLIRYARRRNETRMDALATADRWWWAALGSALLELALALMARLLTV